MSEERRAMYTGSRPVPPSMPNGQPWALRRTAEGLERLANGHSQAGQDARRATTSVTWLGPSADARAGTLTRLTASADAVAVAARDAAAALRTAADALETARRSTSRAVSDVDGLQYTWDRMQEVRHAGDVAAGQQATSRQLELEEEARAIHRDVRRVTEDSDLAQGDAARRLRSATAAMSEAVPLPLPPPPVSGPGWDQVLADSVAAGLESTADLLWSVGDYYWNNPGAFAVTAAHGALMVGGAFLMAQGAGTAVGGGLVTATGVGAPVGAPVAAVGVGLAVAGGAIAVLGAHGTTEDMTTMLAGREQRMRDPGWMGRPSGRPAEVPPDAAPFDDAVASRVPGWGENGSRTEGIVVTEHGSSALSSGRRDVVTDLERPRPGMNGRTMSHVEAQAGATMRTTGATDATLYINRLPCSTATRTGCEELLSRMVPTGARLTVYGPNGYVRVVYGTG